MEDLSYNDPSQGWAWNMRMFSACRAAGLDPCDEAGEGLRLFIERATMAARAEGISVLGHDHYRHYTDSMRQIAALDLGRVLGKRPRLPAPQPVIHTHVRWYIDVMLQPTARASFLAKLSECMSAMFASRPLMQFR